MTDEIALFDRAMEQALHGETLDSLMDRCFAAAANGDWERLRLLDEMVRVATVLATHAVVWEQSRRNRDRP